MVFLAALAPRYVAPVAMLTLSFTIVSSGTAWMLDYHWRNDAPFTELRLPHRFTSIILDALQEALFEKTPGFPDWAHAHHVEPPGGGGEGGADGGGEGADVAAQLPPRLAEQPHAQRVARRRLLGDPACERGEVRLGEGVVTVSQQPEPGHGGEVLDAGHAVLQLPPVLDVEMIEY